jgi:hypothetical protein
MRIPHHLKKLFLLLSLGTKCLGANYVEADKKECYPLTSLIAKRKEDEK